MQITADTHDLKPPRPGRWLGPVGLALVAHALLMGALTWGVHWQKDEPLVSFEAELWSSVPREAAPRAVQPPPPPPPPPEPEARPEPKPEPKPEPRPAPPPPPAVKQADIATAQAKKKVEAEKREQEQAKKADARRKAEALEKEKEKEAKQKAAEKLAQDRKAEEQKKKLAEQKKQEQEKERQAAERRRDELSDKLRADQMARMMGQVGASGSPDARGSAARSSGPSSGYGNRVRERIRPNIRYSEEFPRKLLAEIEVRALADGTITSRRLLKSSGNAAWDDAALRAIDRTGSLPRDVDGRVPSPMIVEMRPLD